MGVQPSTNIWLMKDIPLDNSYTNTILFNNINEQGTWFTNKAVLSGKQLTNQSYQRVGTNRARVNYPYDYIYDFNYMMFQNTGHSSKWYYAFINKCEYVNENCTEITFEIDVMQTWLFEMNIGECFVVREHVNDDSIGAHTVPEYLDTGEYVITSIHKKTYGRGVLIQIDSSTEGQTKRQGGIVNGVFSGVDSYAYNEANIGTLQDTLGIIASVAPEKVVNIQMCSSNMCTDSAPIEQEEDFTFVRDLIFQKYDTEHPVIPGQDATQSGDTYIAINNKLYTAPYCFFTCDNFCGNSEEFHYEDFYNNLTPIMRIHSTPLPVPVITCSPYNYKYYDPTAPNNGGFNNLFAVQFDDFPKCAWTNDTYKAWASRAIPKAIVSTGTTVVTLAMTNAIGVASASFFGSRATDVALNAATLNNAKTSMGLLNSNYDTYLEARYRKVHSASMGGSLASGVNFDLGNIGFRFTCYAIRPEYARRIDDYFTRYGYKIDTIKVPNIRGRKYFNYVKTATCNILGILPNDARVSIENIFSNGITFWHDPSRIGNYSGNVIV